MKIKTTNVIGYETTSCIQEIDCETLEQGVEIIVNQIIQDSGDDDVFVLSDRLNKGWKNGCQWKHEGGKIICVHEGFDTFEQVN